MLQRLSVFLALGISVSWALPILTVREVPQGMSEAVKAQQPHMLTTWCRALS